VGADFDAPSHLLFADGLLYILGAKGKMYKADVSSFAPGNPPMTASSLGVEDIGTVVLSYPFVKNTHQTHPYGITKAPDGSFYITDAAANAVLRRSRTGIYSVVAEVPGVPNPTPVGPPMVESVPTGVIVDHGKLLGEHPSWFSISTRQSGHLPNYYLGRSKRLSARVYHPGRHCAR
jgi:hypothetical protein